MNSENYKIALIGSGNLATHIGLALRKNGIEILQVISKTEDNAKTLGKKLDCDYSLKLKDLHKASNFLIVAVADKVIVEIAKELENTDKLVVHTSGSTAISALEKINNHGVFYPLQTFSKERSLDFSTVPAFIEAGDPQSYQRISGLAQILCSRVDFASSPQRKQMHLAAVFACNFTNYLYSISRELIESEGLNFDSLRPLILETARKVMDIDPVDAQTGPAKRNDVNTMVHHLEMLSNHKEYQKLYSFVSEGISKRYYAENKGNKQFSWDTLKQNLKM
jgi:predicted short-subunit dehydrogenase-like oxidoreductase (DUF2520 family)